MSQSTNPLPAKYMSRGKVISKSRCHKEMWIIDNPDNTFHCIHTVDDVMREMNPPDAKGTILLKAIPTRQYGRYGLASVGVTTKLNRK